jgi:hypothetical protein
MSEYRCVFGDFAAHAELMISATTYTEPPDMSIESLASCGVGQCVGGQSISSPERVDDQSSSFAQSRKLWVIVTVAEQ